MYRAETMYTMDAMRDSITTLVAERDTGRISEEAFNTLIVSNALSAAIFGDDALAETASASFSDELFEEAIGGTGYTDAVMAAIDAFVAAMLA